MVNDQNADLIIGTLGFSYYDMIPKVNYGGEIWCLWNSIKMEVLILAKESRAIHCHIKDTAKSKECILTTIYTPTQERDKDHFWQHLKQLNDFITLPRCIIGDFNEVIQPSDNVRGTPLIVHKMHQFNDFLIATGSIDANVQGRIFTWKKFPRGQLIYEKLDKVIFREDCAHLFPNYVVTNGPFACSDHAFVLLNTEPAHQPRKGNNFKYQHSWAQCQDTHNIVKKNWKMGGQGTPMYRVTQLLKKIKLDLES